MSFFTEREDGLVFSGSAQGVNGELIVNWAMTRFCNFDCFYCYPKNDTPLVLDIDLLKIADFILSLKAEKIRISLTGGEITLHPRFLECVRYLIDQSIIRNKDISIVLLSNMSKPVEFYDEYFSLGENTKVELSLAPTLHRDYISVTDFYEKIKYLNSKNHLVEELAYMIHSEECIDILNANKNDVIQFPFVICFLYDMESDTSRIDKDILEKNEESKRKRYSIYYKDGEYLYDKTFVVQTSYKGFICSIFKNKLNIEANGDITRCDSIKSNKTINVFMDGVLDYIEDNEYVFCTDDRCICGDHIPKFFSPHFKKLKDIDEAHILKNFKKIE